MRPPEDMESRLTRLEENAVFQDRTLEELNQALTAQQRQIDSLEQRLEQAELLIRLLREELDRGGSAGNETPPHYGNPG